MNMEKKKDFLVNLAYWAVIGVAVFLGLKYLLPITVPFILGILVAWLVVWVSRKVRCNHKLFRLALAILVYGIIGLTISELSIHGISALTDLAGWLPNYYEQQLFPFITKVYDWVVQSFHSLDPAIISALEMLKDSGLSSLKGLVSQFLSIVLNWISGLAAGIPNLVLSLLAMIFSTVFVVSDYDNIADFAKAHIPPKVSKVLNSVRVYLTDTLFVVIRSYALIMLLTCTELSILFSVFGIANPILKAAVIAVFDIMPILGTGGIMIPWAIIALVLGNIPMALELFLIYAIVTVVRNYVEPKIVGTQLGLHPIVTLVAMFIGLRIFGFWGLFGLPVAISYFWKQRQTA